MSPYLRLTTLAFATSSALLLAAACSGSDSPPDSEQAVESSGSLDLGLDVEQGVTVSSASYTLTGPGGYSRNGTIDLSSATKLSATLGGIPAGNGYSVSISLASTDGSVSCSGAASFDVAARATTAVTVHLACKEAPKKGSVAVSGSLNACPVIDGVGANPNAAIIGTGIRISADAHDSDAGPAALSYAWTATSGVFDDATAKNPLFTCTLPGPVTIGLTVADGDPNVDCADNLSVTVSCDPPPPQNYSWVELGPGGSILARVITPDASCPSITVDGTTRPMSLRVAAGTVAARTSTASPVKPSAFPVNTCELTLPAGAAHASVYGADLPLPKANPQKIVILGDSGCRLKTGNPWQACSDTTQWPFQKVSDAAAAMHPDLVLHVGDFHYRENECPANVTGCQGSPWSYGFDAWEADLFRPAASLLRAAPWIVVRGNHEECLRAGQGFHRFLDPQAYSASKSCDLAANDNTANYNDPYAVPVGGDAQVIVFDSARSTAAALDPNKPADQFAFNAYQAQLQQVASLTSNPGVFSIFANHHPILGYAPIAGGNPAGGQASLLSVMSTLNGTAYYPPNIGMAVHGHVHDFQAINFATGQAPTIVAGIGGDNLDASLPDPFPFAIGPAAGATPDMIAHDNAFGFLMMERAGSSWQIKAYKIDGTLLTTCALLGNKRLSCDHQGYLH